MSFVRLTAPQFSRADRDWMIAQFGVQKRSGPRRLQLQVRYDPGTSLTGSVREHG